MQLRLLTVLLLLTASLLEGCATTKGLTVSDVDVLRQSSIEGSLLISIGRRERPLPYLPVVYYKVLALETSGKVSVVEDLKSEVMDFRYFNGNHFSGTGKQSVVHLLRLPAGIYWLAGYERGRSAYIPVTGGGGVFVPMSSTAKVRILYRVEVFPGKLTYGGELITNSDSLGSNASVTVYDELDRDLDFVAGEQPHIRNLPPKKSLAVPQGG